MTTIRTIGSMAPTDRLEVEAEATRPAESLAPEARSRDVRIGEAGGASPA